MNKQRIITAVSIIGLVLSTGFTAAQAGHGRFEDENTRIDRAKVVEVDPIVRYVKVSTPERSCWDEPVTVTHYDDNDSVGKTILGGIIGAAVGNNLPGGGKHRKQRAVAGAVIGSVIANQHARQGTSRHDEVRYEKRCDVKHVSHTEERIDGYNVTYKYRGQLYTTRMPYRPGKRIKVRVNVEPVFE